MALDPYAKALYDEYSGKAGGFIGIDQLKLRIPKRPHVLKRHGQLLEEVLDDLAGLPLPWIARPCHRNDFYGLTDAMYTDHGIKDEQELREAIDRIEAEAIDPKRQAFYRAMGEGELDEQVHVMIQTEWPEDIYRGTMMRDCNGELVYNIDDGTRTCGGVWYEGCETTWNLSRAAAWFAKLERSELADPDHLTQMEFGYDSKKRKPMCFAQLRAAFPVPSPAGFEVDRFGAWVADRNKDTHIYGTTPETGFRVTPIAVSESTLATAEVMLDRIGDAPGDVLLHIDEETYRASVVKEMLELHDTRLQKVKVVVRQGKEHTYLLHPSYRMFKAGQVAVDIDRKRRTDSWGFTIARKNQPFYLPDWGREYMVFCNGDRFRIYQAPEKA